jgi:hypothetical protein
MVLGKPYWTLPAMPSLRWRAWTTTKKDVEMNLQIIKWLIAHKDLLLQVVAAVKPWRKDLTPIQHWEIVDQVARIVIPALTQDDIAVLATEDWEDNVEAFTLGVEYSALGVDWVTLIQVIIPILQAILRALNSDD